MLLRNRRLWVVLLGFGLVWISSTGLGEDASHSEVSAGEDNSRLQVAQAQVFGVRPDDAILGRVLEKLKSTPSMTTSAFVKMLDGMEEFKKFNQQKDPKGEIWKKALASSFSYLESEAKKASEPGANVVGDFRK